MPLFNLLVSQAPQPLTAAAALKALRMTVTTTRPFDWSDIAAWACEGAPIHDLLALLAQKNDSKVMCPSLLALVEACLDASQQRGLAASAAMTRDSAAARLAEAQASPEAAADPDRSKALDALANNAAATACTEVDRLERQVLLVSLWALKAGDVSGQLLADHSVTLVGPLIRYGLDALSMTQANRSVAEAEALTALTSNVLGSVAALQPPELLPLIWCKQSLLKFVKDTGGFSAMSDIEVSHRLAAREAADRQLQSSNELVGNPYAAAGEGPRKYRRLESSGTAMSLDVPPEEDMRQVMCLSQQQQQQQQQQSVGALGGPPMGSGAGAGAAF